MKEIKFGRLKSFDERSRNFPIRAKVRGLDPVTKLWECAKVLDQGNEASCVGHGIAHDLISNPIPMLWVDHDYALKIYNLAKELDEWPGEDYEGTSVNAGLKAISQYGLCMSWNWSFSHLDTQLGIAHVAPGIAGTNWYTGMMEPDSNGFIHPTGDNEGGHCYLFNGINIEEKYFTIHNSWGPGWGQNGEAKINFDDYEILRSNDGEMAFLVGETDTGGNDPIPPEPDPGCSFANNYVKLGNKISSVLGRKTRIQIK